MRFSTDCSLVFSGRNLELCTAILSVSFFYKTFDFENFFRQFVHFQCSEPRFCKCGSGRCRGQNPSSKANRTSAHRNHHIFFLWCFAVEVPRFQVRARGCDGIQVPRSGVWFNLKVFQKHKDFFVQKRKISMTKKESICFSQQSSKIPTAESAEGTRCAEGGWMDGYQITLRFSLFLCILTSKMCLLQIVS